MSALPICLLVQQRGVEEKEYGMQTIACCWHHSLPFGQVRLQRTFKIFLKCLVYMYSLISPLTNHVTTRGFLPSLPNSPILLFRSTFLPQLNPATQFGSWALPLSKGMRSPRAFWGIH